MPDRDDANVLKVVGSGPNQEACSRQGYDRVVVKAEVFIDHTIQLKGAAVLIADLGLSLLEVE